MSLMKVRAFSGLSIRFWGRRIILLILFMSGAVASWAARQPVRIYTRRDGLPQAQVSEIQQDSKGYLWVATRAGGIGRFNGQSWTVFDTSSGLPSAGIEAFDISPNGVLFLGTNAGAVRREGEAWILLEMPAQTPVLPVTAILAHAEQGAWIGTASALWFWRGPGQAAQMITAPESAESVHVSSISRGSGNSVWIGTTSGIYRIDAHRPTELQAVPGLPNGAVRAVLDLPGRELYVAVYTIGLFRGTPGHFVRIGDDAAPGRSILCLLAEKDNPDTIWVGTANLGAFRFDGRSWTRFSRSEGFPEQSIDTIFQDREGVLWFGTSVGLVKRGPVSFATFTAEEGFPDRGRFYGMTESRDGDLWFSAYEDGLFRLRADGTVKRYTIRDGLPNAQVNDVDADPAGGVWIATQDGLARIDGDRVQPLKLPANAPTDLRTILVTPERAIYLGTFHDGLMVFQNGRVQAIGSPVGRSITTLFRARDGTIWCGGVGWGAVGLRPDGSTIIMNKALGLPSDQVTYVFEDSRGTLWISTEEGAYRRDADGRVEIYNRATGLPDSYIWWTMEDHDGAIWFGTNHGVARLTNNKVWEIYTTRDGLANDECNEDAIIVDSRGRIFIGTEGLATFLGRPIHKIKPPTLLESVRIGSRFVSPNELKLSPGEGPLVFKLASPSFISEASTRIRYRLVGLSETWSLSEVNHMEIAFGGLGPGWYRFEAKAVAEGEIESDESVVVSIRVPPRWWQSPPFFLSAFIGTALLIFTAVRVREKRLEQSKHHLEVQVQRRTDELRLANERLAELAIKDDLTDLPNRRAVLERLHSAISEARRRSCPLVVAMIDVNNFKKVNDRLGHEIGDTVLRRIATAMRLTQRQEDTLGRYGGDEFLAVMLGCDEANARRVMDRLKQAVTSIRIAGTEAVVGPEGFSVSVGLASFDASTLDERDLVRKADDALYRAKAALGKNNAGGGA